VQTSLAASVDSNGPPVSNAVNDVEYLSLTAMSGGEKQNQGLWQSSTFTKFVESIMSLYGTNPAVALQREISTTSAQTSLYSLLRELQEESLRRTGTSLERFVSICIEMTSSFQSCVSKTACLKAINSFKDAEGNSSSMHAPQPQIAQLVLTGIVLSIGIICSPFRDSLEPLVCKLISLICTILPETVTRAADTTAIQCLTLQSLLSFYHPSAGSSWHLLGLSVTKAISSGLHRPSPSETPPDEIREHNSLLFWTVYSLDHALATAMGRPFGMEDEDITLELPDLPVLHTLDGDPAASQALFIWRLHHARLLSSWRREPNLDLATSIAGHKYWRETYRGLNTRISRWTSNTSPSNNTNTAAKALADKDELQISSQALTQLICSAAAHDTANTYNAAFIELKQSAISEIPRFVQSIQSCIDSHNITLTFLDGYDVFACAIVYAYCLYTTQQTTHTFRLGMAQMRTITSSIDIIQHIGQTFKSLRIFRDVIWDFLMALEARSGVANINAQGQDSGGNIAQDSGDATRSGHSDREFDGYEVPIPNHLRQLMASCLET